MVVAMGNEPLRNFAALRTRDPDELRERIAPLYAVTRIELPRSSTIKFNAVLNHRELRDVGLSYARYGAPIQATMANTDFYAQGFGIRGRGEVVVQGRAFNVSDNQGGSGGPGAIAHLHYSADLEHVFLKIKPAALIAKLSAMLGAPVNPPLRLHGEYNPAALIEQFRLVSFVISELDRTGGLLSPLVLAELEQALIVTYLCSNLNNYTARLNGAPPTIASWQVRRATDYIEANWDQPITIEALALVTHSSARSLFAAFKKSRGCSPMRFVRQVRLQHARDMLTRAGPAVSVTSVALDCGFNNLGHFTKDYLSSFGERPSETLRRGRK
jgi:AraC-like DNA-binding protein